jgi:carboxyl-terminal processing protease
MKSYHKSFCPLVVCGLAVAFQASWALSEPAPEKSDAAKILAHTLPRAHISHEPFNSQVATNALNTFLDSLDFDHTLFLASDIADFHRKATNLHERIRAGDVALAFKVYNVLLARLSNRVEYIDILLTNGFTMAEKETYQWKRKDAPWPADRTEWNELWRKKIKNQLITKLVADKLAEEDKVANTNSKPSAITNGTESVGDAKLTPESAVRKGFKQYLTVLNDYDPAWVLERYLTAFTQSYDPHSDYLSPNNAEDFDIGMKLSLVGVGALLSSEDGAAKIERLIPGGPAEHDGRLKPGDKIIAVAQGGQEPVSILHWPLSKAVRIIRGEKNTKVVLTVIPASDPTGGTTKKIDLIRDEVKLEEQAAKGEVKDIQGADGVTRKFGVIRLPEFYADVKGRRENGNVPRSSSRDVEKILVDLKTNRISGLVLDLRNNGGGLLAEAVEMTGLFINSGPVVQVSDGRATEVLSDDDPDITFDGPLVVLVNRETASASEILAGALQDYGRAIIVGDTKTHGKGTVQSMAILKNGDPSLGTLKVTTASFYRIAGGSTQLKGVTPDIITPSILDSIEVGEEYLPHALAWSAVFPALYRRAADLHSILSVLKQQSEERQRKDSKFVAYRSLVKQLGERQKTSEISLNFEERLKLARSEKELQNLLQDTNGPSEEKDKKNQDIILNEAVNILSDFTILEQKLTDTIRGRKEGTMKIVEK